MSRLILLALVLLFLLTTPLRAQPRDTTDRSWEIGLPRPIVNLAYGKFAWKSSPVLIWPAQNENDTTRGIKEPTAVRFAGKWHLFATVRGEKPSHQIAYLSFADWPEADKSPRHILKLDDNHAASPQVFYFEPQRKWYLIYQIEDPKKKPQIQPVFSTTEDLANPASWTRPQPLFKEQPDNIRLWTDFWVICSLSRAYLFFSSRDGNLWRSQTNIADFPAGWSRPQSCLEADVLQGARIYKLRRLQRYLVVIEANDTGRRYCKAFWSEHINGRWDELASSAQKPFASPRNVKQDPRWIESLSRGEILRTGHNQFMEIDPMHLQFLFAGIDQYDKIDRPYGQIPWRIGLLEPQ